MMSTKLKKYHIAIDNNNFIVRDHRVYGVRVLPGVALLDVVYRLGGAYFGDKKFHLENVIFYTPIATSKKFDQNVEVTIEEFDDVSYRVVIESQAVGESVSSQKKKIKNCECIIVRAVADNQSTSSFSADSFIESCDFKWDMEDVYSLARRFEIDHRTFMKSLGRIYSHHDEELMHLHLGPLSKEYHPQFYLHPAFLDSATTAGSTQLLKSELGSKKDRLKPYIPFTIKKFFAYQQLPDEILVFSRSLSGESRLEETDVVHRDIKIFSTRGDLIAGFEKLSSKKIRNMELIKNLETLPFEVAGRYFHKELNSSNQSTEQPSSQTHTKTSDQNITEVKKEAVIAYLVRLIDGLIDIKEETPDVNAGFYDLGLDSASLLNLTRRIEEDLNVSLYPTLLFEHPTIVQLADYFLRENYRSKFWDDDIPEDNASPNQREEGTTADNSYFSQKNDSNEIAVIGLSGRYPGAESIDELWDNLCQGVDSVQEVPTSRWNHKDYYDQSGVKNGKTYSKWGGFLSAVDEFDPLFFGITPTSAESMDPQSRLFMQEAWRVIEDAGYKPSALRDGDVGVFVGVFWLQYQLLGATEQQMDRGVFTESFGSSIANQVSYFFGFHGPSMAIDTQCSSSLTAVHLACQSIRSGECEMAIAGGVSLMVHPSKYVNLSQLNFLSKDGRCRSFGDGGSGYVPGEGVGCALLKPLVKAVSDRDIIYGVIRGSAINHGGRTSGYTVPSPDAQRNVINKAFSGTNIDPREVSYIEAHGTGTSLGDPIELAALAEVFQLSDLGTRKLISIGSIKSNIGHLEAAAGIAALTKTLLQFKNRRLVPSLHSENLNPRLRINSTVFKVQQDLDNWKPTEPDSGRVLTAGISAFGAGGSNSHLILSEGPLRVDQIDSDEGLPKLIIISAKNLHSLTEYSKQLRNFCARTTDSLQDIAYTLQIGREEMEERLAFVANDLNELIHLLDEFIEGSPGAKSYFRNRVDKKIVSEPKRRINVGDLNRKEDFSNIAEDWTNGAVFDWEVFYKDLNNETQHRVSLPTYRFLKDRYWATIEESNYKKDDRAKTEASPTILLECFWNPISSVAKHKSGKTAGRKVTIIDLLEYAGDQKEWKLKLDGQEIIEFDSPPIDISSRYCFYAEKIFLLLKDLLLSNFSGRQLIQVMHPGTPEGNLYAGLSGLLKTATQENPKLHTQLIEIDPNTSIDSLESILDACAADEHTARFRSRGSAIETLSLRERSYPESHSSAKLKSLWRDQGVYLITGGLGGLGFIFAQEVARSGNDCRLIITGRSSLTDENLRKLEILRDLRLEVEYIVSDIEIRTSLDEMIDTVVRRYGTLTGIIHSAGILRDNFIIKKSSEEFLEVLGAKVQGTINLDLATRSHPLEFFVMFSSLAGSFGNIGQADYAAANGFMDRYASFRNTSVQNGLCRGNSLSIAWPFWESGGMTMDAESLRELKAQTGIDILTNSDGIQTFYDLVACSLSSKPGFSTNPEHVMVLSGDVTKIRKIFVPVVSENPPSKKQEEGFQKKIIRKPIVNIDPSDLRARLISRLLGIIHSVTKLREDQIDITHHFQEYGIDSIVISKFNNELKDFIPNIPKTLLYENTSLESVAEYLIAEHPADCGRWVGDGESLKSTYLDKSQQSHESSLGYSSDQLQNDRHSGVKDRSVEYPLTREPIAIIGLSGRYPGSSTLEDFWKKLVEGRSCFSEVPAHRWTVSEFYCADKDTARLNVKSYCNWGGFINDCEMFDPLFFNLSPFEAINMDPQERQLLLRCWEAVEDAGYGADLMTELYDNDVGVFIGVTKNGFNLHTQLGESLSDSRLPVTSFSSMANRISYHMNFSGPSMAIDTMCASSLTALHEGCENVLRGDCEMAVVGGVNLYTHPRNLIDLCLGNMLTDEKKIRSFSNQGQGFLPGEGVGAVIIKTLSRAEADGDEIYSVIRSTALAHGGKGSNYFSPNSQQQIKLIKKVLSRAELSIDDIDYVESAANGSEIGDAIEVNTLTSLFKNRKNPCYLGTIKPNIGHLEAASGLSQLTKVVLQSVHRKFVPTLDADAQDSENSLLTSHESLRLVREVTPWSDLKGFSGCSLITSYGAAGSYAAAVVEPYVNAGNYVNENNEILNTSSREIDRERLFVLSARTKAQLIEYVIRLQAYLRQKPESLDRIAYTLQTGRNTMVFRLAIVSNSISSLIASLENVIHDITDSKIVIGDNSNRQSSQQRDSLSDINVVIEKAVEQNDLLELAVRWVGGNDSIPWETLYSEQPKRCHLPTYPFEQRPHLYPSQINTTEPLRNDVPQNSTNFDSSLIGADKTAFETSGAKTASLDSSAIRQEKIISQSPVSHSSADVLEIVIDEDDREFWMPNDDEKPTETVTQIGTGTHASNLIAIEIDADDTEFWKPLDAAAPSYATGNFADTSKNKTFAITSQGKNDASILVSEQKKYGIYGSNFEANFSANDTVGITNKADNEGSRSSLSFRSIEEGLKLDLRETLLLQANDNIDTETTFSDLGLDSITRVHFVKRINRRYDISMSEILIFEHSTISSLAKYIEASETNTKSENRENEFQLSPESSNGIAETANETTELVDTEIDSLNSLENVLRNELRNVLLLNNEDISVATPFSDLGLDSISRVHYVASLGEKLGITVREATIFDHPSIKALAQYLWEQSQVSKINIQVDPYDHFQRQVIRAKHRYEEVVHFSSSGTGPVIFCFPPMSGDVGIYNKLAYGAESAFRMIGLRSKGFLSEDASMLGSIEDMARYNAMIIQEIDESGPYFLMGSSKGGVVAYEVAKLLVRSGKKVNGLFLLESPVLRTLDDEQCWQTDQSKNLVMNANFLLISQLHKDAEFLDKKSAEKINWDDYRITASGAEYPTEEAFVDSLVVKIVGYGVKENPSVLRSRLKSMAATHLNNLSCFIRYRLGDACNELLETPTIMFRSETANAVSKDVYNPDYLLKVQEQKGSMDVFLSDWSEKIPALRTEVVPGDNHFDLLGRPETVDHIIRVINHTLNPNAALNTPRKLSPLRDVSNKVAVIGMAGRFPSADNIDAFWTLLSNGGDGTRPFLNTRYWTGEETDYFNFNVGFLEDVDKFDWKFFGITPKDAEYIDPSERLFLQEVWRAIEDSGIDPTLLSGKQWGVFCGGGGDYGSSLNHILGFNPNVTTSSIAARVSYQLDLKGPCISVDAGCASSALAISQACDALIAGQCESAIAGGSYIHSTPNLLLASRAGGLLSQPRRSFVLDREARGMTAGEAVAAVILKPLKNALADGDRVYGVIEGWGTNHCGRSNGMAAPSSAAQVQLLSDIYQKFKIDPKDIDFFELNASGTPVGDMVEVDALKKSFTEESHEDAKVIHLSSVENTIGHPFHSSGVCHLIKLLLSLHHEKLTPFVNAKSIDPKLELENSRFEFNEKLADWSVHESHHRRGALNSSSATGHNVHMVVSGVEHYMDANRALNPKAWEKEAQRDFELICISAKSETALQKRFQDLLSFIDTDNNRQISSLAHLASNLLNRRSHFRYRCGIVCCSLGELKEKLECLRKGESVVNTCFGEATDSNQELLSMLSPTLILERLEDSLFAEKTMKGLAKAYCQGEDLTTIGLYRGKKFIPLSLPGYPFDSLFVWHSRNEAPNTGLQELKASMREATTPETGSVLDTVKSFITDITGFCSEDIHQESSLSEIGLDSLMSMRLLASINKKFDIDLQIHALLEIKSIIDIRDLINENLSKKSNLEMHKLAKPADFRSDLPIPKFLAARLNESPGLSCIVRDCIVDHSYQGKAEDLLDDLHDLLEDDAGVYRDGSVTYILSSRPEALKNRIDKLRRISSKLQENIVYCSPSKEQYRQIYQTEVLKSSAWTLHHVYEITVAELNPEYMEKAFQSVVETEDLFRTTYMPTSSGWIQVVNAVSNGEQKIKLIAMNSLEEFYELIRRERCELMDLASSSPVKVWLCEIEGTHYLGFIFHHSLADAFTPALLFERLMNHYASLIETGKHIVGERDSLASEQYWCYALNSNCSLNNKSDLLFWKDTLNRTEFKLPFRSKQLEISRSDFAIGDAHWVPIENSKIEAILAFCKSNETTLTQVIIAAIIVVLTRGLGNRELTFELINTRRDSLSRFNALGEFTNSTFWSLFINEDSTFMEVVTDVKSACLQSLVHGKVSFEDLLALSGIDGYQGYFSKFDNILIDSADIDSGTNDASENWGESRYFDMFEKGSKSNDFKWDAVSSLFFQFVRVNNRARLITGFRKKLFSRESIITISDAILRVLDLMIESLEQVVVKSLAEIAPLTSLSIYTQECSSPRFLEQDKFDSSNKENFPASRIADSYLSKIPLECQKLNSVVDGSPVFWIHAAFGDITIYKSLAEKIARPFYGILPRGLVSDDICPVGVPAIARLYCDMIKNIQPHGPYDIGGFSIGGVFAYEITAELIRRGEDVNSLILIDSLYPYHNLRISPSYYDSLYFILVAMIDISHSNYAEKIKYLSAIQRLEKPSREYSDQDAIFSSFVDLCAEAGVKKPRRWVEDWMRRIIRIHECFSIENYNPTTAILNVSHAHYFKNKDGFFFGENLKYYSLNSDDPTADIDYWSEWKGLIQNIEFEDLSVESHIQFFEDEESIDRIFDYCMDVYS